MGFLGYDHNGFVATHALVHIVHSTNEPRSTQQFKQGA